MAGSSTTRSRTRKTAPKKAAADPLPITAAELDGLDGEARAAAELERSALIEQAVKDAGESQLPQLGGQLPEAERGPIADPSPRNKDPQQAAIEKAVSEIDWQGMVQAQRDAEAAQREAWE